MPSNSLMKGDNLEMIERVTGSALLNSFIPYRLMLISRESYLPCNKFKIWIKIKFKVKTKV